LREKPSSDAEEEKKVDAALREGQFLKLRKRPKVRGVKLEMVAIAQIWRKAGKGTGQGRNWFWPGGTPMHG